MDKAEHGRAPTPAPAEDYETALAAADRLIAHSPLGGYGAFMAPFSRQFRNNIRQLFPEEAAAFDYTDAAFDDAVGDAIRLRRATFVVFLAWSALLAAAASRLFGQARWDHAGWELAGGFAIASLIAVGVRRFIRHDLFQKIEKDAATFSSHFHGILSRLHDRATNATNAAHSDGQLSTAWPERSAAWVKIALWHGKRYENLDRYVTASAWKIESRWRLTERVFRDAKIAVAGLLTLGVLALAAWQLWQGAWLAAVQAGLMLAVYLVCVIRFWGVGPQGNNALWAEVFREHVADLDREKEHIHNAIANVVRADKTSILGARRTVGKEPQKP